MYVTINTNIYLLIVFYILLIHAEDIDVIISAKTY